MSFSFPGGLCPSHGAAFGGGLAPCCRRVRGTSAPGTAGQRAEMHTGTAAGPVPPATDPFPFRRRLLFRAGGVEGGNRSPTPCWGILYAGALRHLRGDGVGPQPGEAVLDLCAAPGGKSTQIAAALRGEGVLWCNEFVRERARALMQNLERCGVRNAVVTSSDTASLCAGLTERFDAVLVDAPCSGEGMFRKEPAALAQWSEELIRQCAARQTRILDDAAQAVRRGGRLLYSTCTFAPEENELAVCRFLASHPDFCLEDLSALPFGRPGFVWEQVVPFAAGETNPDVPDPLPPPAAGGRRRRSLPRPVPPGRKQPIPALHRPGKGKKKIAFL